MQEIESYKFCPQCGGPLAKRLIKLGEPERLVCTVCGYVFYIDPKLAAIAVIPLDGGIVMVRRAINPGYGLWVAPGGFVDAGETVEDALVREALEEVRLHVRPVKLLGLHSYAQRRTVVVSYLTQYLGGELAAGDEALEARIFARSDIPWEEIAFSSTREALQRFLKENPS
jgi:ADP-ribose pyrophosphatase YjhB (NUDIX family)